MTVQKVTVAGGFGVLGQAICDAFRRRGHIVTLVGCGAQRTHSATAHVFGGADLTDCGPAQSAFTPAGAAMGGVDVLINAAGAFSFSTVGSSDSALGERMFRANLFTCANMCRVAAGRLTTGGANVNVGAAGAVHAGAGMGLYAAAKSAIARPTESLAAELDGRVRVNAILPMVLDRPPNRADMPYLDPRHWTSPDAVADVVVFLASIEARAIDGALIRTKNGGV